MDYVLGIDLGTSYFKLGLFNESGDQCGLGRVRVEKDIDDGRICELSTEKFKILLCSALKQALYEANAKATDIKSISYSSQADSFVLLDKNNSPLTPLILWPDNRCNENYEEVVKLWQQDDFLETTGLGIEAHTRLTINKLLWFRENEPEIWQKTKHIISISSYLTFLFTGELVSDLGSASLLGLIDLEKRDWWDKAFQILSFDKEMFPKLISPGSLISGTCNMATEFFGIAKDIPFVAGSLDHFVAALGAGVGKVAQMSESTGTVLACVIFTNNYTARKNVCIGAGFKDGEFCQLTSDTNGATVLEWYRNNYASEKSFEQLSKEAQEIPSGCEGLIALPYTNTFDGLSGFKNKKPNFTDGHFVRAIMESTAKTLKQLVSTLSPDEKPATIVATGGGAKSDLWLKIKAQILNLDFIVTNFEEPACKGAAILAANQLARR